MSPAREELIERFNYALKNKKLAHSYIFSGPRGVGKKEFALELASAVNCESKRLPSCKECLNCKKTLSLSHPDVFLIERDSPMLLIDQMRELSKMLSYKSYQGGWKIAIIPDAERMTKQAMNAILKTVEEPQPDTMLIFTTSNLSRMLPTIISRCQVIRFGPKQEEEIKELLKQKLGLGLEELELIARLSQGSAEWALAQEPEVLLEERAEFLREWFLQGSENFVLKDLKRAKDKLKREQLEKRLEFLIMAYRDLLLLKFTDINPLNLDIKDLLVKKAFELSEEEIFLSLEKLIQATIFLEKANTNPDLTFDWLAMELIKIKQLES